ncbi:hypothetical protein QPK14_04020 [Photorhabdus temperata subsp. temperata]
MRGEFIQHKFSLVSSKRELSVSELAILLFSDECLARFSNDKFFKKIIFSRIERHIGISFSPLLNAYGYQYIYTSKGKPMLIAFKEKPMYCV